MSLNIKQAKQEITNTLKAYLQKDELGNYRIPEKRQRPILLMGPPGVGKTQIMEQIAAETGVGLVAYTITHHTRQSAIGLPFIVHKTYHGEEVAVTQYTMSEILASVYDLIEETGIREGILFLDEINCVSETLTPVMLQFLQYKTFGNRKLPEGWLIVAAGNPPEYNRSARDFDVVTLDRSKRIDVHEDFGVWKEYALRNGLHGAVISYLDIKKENFYRVENTMDGLQFVTARGWEDLSEVLLVYDSLGMEVDRQLVEQYIQMPVIAKDFANYLDLYHKYQDTYHVEEILSGTWTPLMVRTLKTAPFDEKLSVMGLLVSRLSESARKLRLMDTLADRMYDDLLQFRDVLSADKAGSPEDGPRPADLLESLAEERQVQMKRSAAASRLSKEEQELTQREIGLLEEYAKMLRTELGGDAAAADAPSADAAGEAATDSDAAGSPAMDLVRERFRELTTEREQLVEATSAQFDNAFRFLEESVGQRQELVLFVTEITAGYDTSWFVEHFGCEAYYRHNRELFFDDVEQRIRNQLI